MDALAARAATGDWQAANRLLETLHPAIVRYCRGRIGRSASTYHSADDAAQEALLGIYAALPTYQHQLPFLALAYRIAANKVADHFRRHQANRSTLVADVPDTGSDRPDPERALLSKELNHRLSQLLDVLSDRQREILTLRLGAGMSTEEIAQALNSIPGAIRVAQHRALKLLRSAISAARHR